MNLPKPRSFLPRLGLACARLKQVISGAGWPVQAGLCAGLCGLLMLGASWYFQRQIHQPLVTTPTALLNQTPNQSTAKLLPPSGAAFAAPAASTHLDDLALVFRLAKVQGVKIGTIEYHLETSTALPLLVRTLDLRINEDYPKLKAFMAELLDSLPHVSVQEIRAERKDTAALQEQIMLKLSFVYQTAAKSAAVTPGQHRLRNPDAATGDHPTLP